MDSNHKSFKYITPYQGYPVKEVSYSPTGSHFIAVCGDRKVKVFDWDGILKRETVRGDVFMNDVNNTRGHIGETTAGKWHWTSKNHFMTASRDGSIWIWDIEGRLIGVEQ